MTAPVLSLPIDARQLLPHRPPMLLVEQLVAIAEKSGGVTARIEPDNIFVDAHGQLAAVALVELVAQAYATIKGYQDTVNNLPVRHGFLVGGRMVKILRCPRVGDYLTINIETAVELDDFSVIDGLVRCGEEVLACGSIKLWIP